MFPQYNIYCLLKRQRERERERERERGRGRERVENSEGEKGFGLYTVPAFFVILEFLTSLSQLQD